MFSGIYNGSSFCGQMGCPFFYGDSVINYGMVGRTRHFANINRSDMLNNEITLYNATRKALVYLSSL